MNEHPQRELSRISSLLFNTPWMISENWMDRIIGIVEAHQTGAVDLSTFQVEERSDEMTIQDGLATIPIRGPMFRNAPMMAKMSGARSVIEIRSDFSKAMLDQSVRVVLLDIDSPGGEVQGIPEFAGVIAKAVTETDKQIVAFTEGQMLSAALFIGSQADRVIASPSALVGSIGVVMKILDTSRISKNTGFDETVIRTGANKQIGSGPVTQSQIDTLQTVAEKFFTQFTDAVTSARGALSEEATDGRIFVADDALEQNLVDEILTLEDLKRELVGGAV